MYLVLNFKKIVHPFGIYEMGFQKPNPMSECKKSKVFDASLQE